MILPQIVLREHSQKECRKHGRVDTNRQVSELGDEDGCEDVVESDFGVVFV